MLYYKLLGRTVFSVTETNMSRLCRRTTDGAAMHGAHPLPQPTLPPSLPPVAVTVLVSRARSVGGAAVGQGRATATHCRH